MITYHNPHPSQMQNLWRKYVVKTYESCAPEFWEVFNSVMDGTTACKDAVLSVVKKLTRQRSRSWPQSVRTLRQVITRKAGKFWDNITEVHTIDVESFGIPGCSTVQFTFVDPIFLWAQRCDALFGAGIKLHWEAKTLMSETGEQLYGAGVQYGTLFRCAQGSVPQGGKPALISLSWDAGNTGFGSRSTKPLCLQVIQISTYMITCAHICSHMHIYVCR